MSIPKARELCLDLVYGRSMALKEPGSPGRFFFSFLFFFLHFRAAPKEYGSSQARDQIRATAAGLHHSHSNAESKQPIRPIPQLTAILDP